MGNTTNRFFLGVVKLNLPFRVERVELAPLVFVPAFIITIYILAAIASLFHKPEEKVDNIVKEVPSGIQVSNTVAGNTKVSLDEDDLLYGFKTEEDMMKVRNLGRKSLDEVVAKLASLGFTLHKEDE